jgi:hypothetical protein
MTESFDDHKELNIFVWKKKVIRGNKKTVKKKNNPSEVSHDNVPTLVARTCDVTVVKG